MVGAEQEDAPRPAASAPGKEKGTIVALGAEWRDELRENRQNHETEDDSAPDHADRALPSAEGQA